MVTLQLAAADAAFLKEQLGSQLNHIENELVHTDDRSMQRALAADLERLKTLCDRVVRAVEADRSEVSV